MPARPFDKLPAYCLRCHIRLHVSDGEESSCPRCHLTFDTSNAETYSTRRPKYRFWAYHVPVILLTIVLGVVSYACIHATGELGLGIFIALPFSLGAILGLLFNTRLFVTIASIFTVCVGTAISLYTLDISGLFCAAIGALICAVPGFSGVFFGHILRSLLKGSNWSQRNFLPLFCISALPYLVVGIEISLPDSRDIAQTTTEVLLDVPPRIAWQSIVFYEEVKHDPPLILRMALPNPVGTVGLKDRVGNIVRCLYDTGHITKMISEVKVDRLLAFDVIEQAIHFENDVTLLGGKFELSAVDGDPGKTRISLTTRFVRHLSPRWLWLPIEHRVVRQLHSHVLQGMRKYAEVIKEGGTRQLAMERDS